MFSIAGIVASVGASVTGHTLKVVDVVRTHNDNGDADEIETEYDIDGVIQIMSAGEDEVKEGILCPMDIIGFFDDSEINQIKLKNNNKLKYDGKKYGIVQVIREIGHTEVLAKKL